MSPDPKKFKETDDVLTIGTHDGIFHCDEVLACFMLQQLPKYANAKVVRSRVDAVLDVCDIVVDVGSIFDKSKNRFDHHQKTFTDSLSSLRPELGSQWTVRLSSAGLVYTYFGEDVIRQVLKHNAVLDVSDECLQQVYRKVYEYFIQEIDAIDNGVPMFDGEPLYSINSHVSARVGKLNAVWNSSADFDVDAQFKKAQQLVGQEFVERVLYYTTIWWPARSIVQDAIKERLNVYASGEILELKQFCPWKEHLFELEKDFDIVGLPKFVLMENKPADFRVIAVPNAPNSFVCRKFLHKDWRGVRDSQLATVSGIADASFVHATGFIGGSKSRNGALEMAIQSLSGPAE